MGQKRGSAKLGDVPTTWVRCLLTLFAQEVSEWPNTNTTGGLTLEGTGLAMHGYDAVAYFAESKSVIGSSDRSATYNDTTYRFVNAKNMEKFRQDPAKHAPQYGGYCAFGASVGKKFEGDPRYWTIVDDKLYLNHNQKVLKRWRENPTDRIAKANKHWSEIAQKSPSDL